MEKSFEFRLGIRNKNIKNVYLEPNAFGWEVKEGDVLRVIVHGEDVPECFFDKGTPFLFEILENSVILWFNIVPEKVYLNDKLIS